MHLSRVMKLLLYATLSLLLPLRPRPHDANTCPLCIVPDAAFVRHWLQVDGRKKMEDEVQAAITELHCFPERIIAQRAEQLGRHLSIQYSDIGFFDAFIASSLGLWVREHQIDLTDWVRGEALYECEVRVDDWECQLHAPVRMQSLAWRFVLCQSAEGPMQSELSRECTS